MVKKTGIIIGLFLFILLVGASNTNGISRVHYFGLDDSRSTFFGVRLPSNATLLAELAEAMDFRVHDTTQSFRGLTIQTIGIIPNQSVSNDRVGYLAVTDAYGNVVNGFYIDDDMPIFPQLINATTILYCVKGRQNISLWNMVTNVTVPLFVPRGHHDVDYNALTNTFLGLDSVTLQTYDHESKTYNVEGDDIVEYDWNGNEIWRWDCNDTFPFDVDEFHLVNETKKSDIDWMHSNSLYWDVDEDMIYMNVRSRDCVVKVNHATNETVWVLGRYTGEGPELTLYNQEGEQVDSLFYHAHACEMNGPNRFIIYDNDYYNITRLNPEIGITRVVEFEVDEVAMTATETWSWTAPASYYCNSQGDANLLPNGNRFSLYSQSPEPLFVEVNQAGDTVWEMVLNVTANDVGWRTSANGAEHFYEEPQIVLDESSYSVFEGTPIDVGFSAWDTFKRRHTTDVTVRVLGGGRVFAEQDLQLLPHWQETDLTISVSGLPAGVHNLTLEVENPEGQTGRQYFTANITTAFLLPVNLVIFGVTIIVIVIILAIFIWYYRSKHKMFFE